MTISRTQMRTQLTGDRMPAKSEKQRRYMAMAYNDPEMGVSKEVAKKFMKKPAKGYKKGGMPDLTGDGKVTQADVLKGRGVFKKGGKVKKYQAGNMVSPDEAALLRGNAAMDRISEEGTTNMMEGMKAKDPRSMRPKKRPADPRSMKPKARPQPMTKKQQRIAGAKGAASQYDTGTRDTPASEPVLRQGAKDTAKRQLDSLMGGGAKKALGMMAGGKVKKMKSGGKIRGYGIARGGKACKMR